MKKIIPLFALLVIFFSSFAFASENSKKDLYVFVRDTCSYCKAEKEFLSSDPYIKSNANVVYLNLDEKENESNWKLISQKHKTGLVTPITLVGGDILVGFNPNTTPEQIKKALKNPNVNFQFYTQAENLELKSKAGACDENETSVCEIDFQSDKMTVPYFGEISPKEISLFSLAGVLGFIDGFNPCAMWVLLTFLLVLSQVGSKKKMVQIVGLFLLAEAIMYYLILNVWYATWDFVALDGYVTPAVGLLATGSGVFFIYRFVKSKKDSLTCDVSSLNKQNEIIRRIKDLTSRPMTLAVIFGVLLLAFSVNVIEFACSIGIPQTFTKILDINELNFLTQQFYTLVYTFFYMADDIVVFALAVWGYSKLHTVGAKYSRYSTLVAGVLMLLLGAIMLFRPELLVF